MIRQTRRSDTAVIAGPNPAGRTPLSTRLLSPTPSGHCYVPPGTVRYVPLYKPLIFQWAMHDERVVRLLNDYRLLVNKAVRYGLQSGVTSKFALCKHLYAQFRCESDMYSKHVVSTFEVAASILKNYRHRARRGLRTKPPFVKRLFLKTENQAFRLDRKAGILRFPLRSREYVWIQLPVNPYHKGMLEDPGLSLGSLTLMPDRIIIAFRKEAPIPFQPEGLLALDTNESSLDGVHARAGKTEYVRARFPEVRHIQSLYFRRRRKLAKKKPHDARIRRRLLHTEGSRERRRVKQRLHILSKGIVAEAAKQRCVLVLEELSIPKLRGRSRRMNRRLSVWPQAELHRQIEYKARWIGVPVLKIDPRNTSRRCPACGWCDKSRMRVASVKGVFTCPCGWRLDRQLNAGVNILQTALASNEALARAVRFQPGALRHDVVIPLCAPKSGAREEPNEGSLAEGKTEPSPTERILAAVPE